MSLRDEFPVLREVAYLNAGSCGPVARPTRDAAVAAIDEATYAGRGIAYFEARLGNQPRLREACARLLGCPLADMALTTSTSEGLGKVLSGMRLGRGDEILTATDEHPGLIGPLLAAQECGATVRAAPLHEIAGAVTSRTTVVACSHVSWITGALADPALAEVEVPVILDGAQSAGAIPVDVEALGCEAYAAAGQKWLCGADGTGLLYVAPELQERLVALGPGYTAFEKTDMFLESPLHHDARRHDTPSLPREGVAMTLAALAVFEDHGWDKVFARARELASSLAESLAERGKVVAPRGETTLVSWEDPTPQETAARIREQGVLVRHLPGTPYVRASVGAWNDEGDLERLLALV